MKPRPHKIQVPRSFLIHGTLFGISTLYCRIGLGPKAKVLGIKEWILNHLRY